MKTTPILLLCLAAGFVSARWAGPSALGREKRAAAAAPKVTFTPAPAKPPRGLPAEGDWQPAAAAWAKEDPAGFYQWLVSRETPPGNEVLRALFLEWVKRDPDAAFEAALNLPGDFQREENLLGDMLGSALAEPGGLRKVLQWAPLVEEQISSWGSPSDEWVKSAPLRETAEIFRNVESKGWGYTGTLVEQFSKHWAKTDLPGALAWMDSLAPGMKGSVFQGLMEAWSNSDPQAALAFLATEATSEQRWNAYKPLAKLAETDPRAAMDWWEENRGVPDYNCVRQIFGKWTDKNAGESLDYVLGIEDPALRRHCMEAWGESVEPQKLLETYQTLETAELRETVVKALTYTLWKSDQQGTTVRDLIKADAFPELTPAMAAGVTRSMAYGAPEKALEWAVSLPERLQAESVAAVMSQWKDKVAAAQAMEKLPEGPVKTAAREAVLKR